MVKKVIAIALCVALLCIIPFFGSSGYQDTESFTDAPNLAAAQLKTVSDAGGSEKQAVKAVDGDIKSVWKTAAKTDSLTLTFQSEQTFNTIILREKGWNVKKFNFYYWEDNGSDTGTWKLFYSQDKIEDYRYCAFEPVTTSALRLEIAEANEVSSIRELEVYNVPKKDLNGFRVTTYMYSTTLTNDDSFFEPDNPNYLYPAYFDTVNQINIFLGSWDSEGGITLGSISPEVLKKQLAKLRAVIGGRDVKILPCIGVGPDPDACLTDYKDRLVQNVIGFLNEYGFDGVNYNWEFPNGQKQYDLFSEHLVTLKKELVKHDKILTAAWYSWGIKLSDEAIKAHDQVEIMGYDTFDTDGNNASFISGCVQNIQYFLDLGFEPEQLSIGMPYYGRPPTGDYVWMNYDDPDYSIGYFDNYVDGQWFSGPQMTRDKTAYAVARGLGGVMIFHLALDTAPDQENCLTNQISEVLNERAGIKAK